MFASQIKCEASFNRREFGDPQVLNLIRPLNKKPIKNIQQVRQVQARYIQRFLSSQTVVYLDVDVMWPLALERYLASIDHSRYRQRTSSARVYCEVPLELMTISWHRSRSGIVFRVSTTITRGAGRHAKVVERQTWRESGDIC